MDAPDTYLELIAHVDDLVASFSRHPDERVREQAAALLSGLDALHRTALERLVERLTEAGGGAALEQATHDPVVRIVLGLYDLAELDLPPDDREEAAGNGFVPLEHVDVIPEDG